MKTKALSLEEMEFVAHRLVQELLVWGEPIPDFSTCFPHVLGSCLAAPSQSFGGRGLYQGLIGKTAVLFYFLIKNHPFRNGNKRIALTTLLILLHKNGAWLKTSAYDV